MLTALGAQESAGRFTYSIVVADNDDRESARAIVNELAESRAIPTRYCVEPRKNIALARNRAVENAEGDFIAFIDDDEEPCAHWLSELVQAIETYEADGVLGPVVPRFLTPPPEWILRGKFFERPSPATGTWLLRWNQTRTGNVLLRRRIFADRQAWFRAEYGSGGEDADFFCRMIAGGHRFVWCAEAPVYERVPPERCRRTYLLQRALRRGGAPTVPGKPLLISLIAALLYAVALPVLPLFGQHVFMRYLVKECDHLGRILATAGLYRRGEWR